MQAEPKNQAASEAIPLKLLSPPQKQAPAESADTQERLTGAGGFRASDARCKLQAGQAVFEAS